MVDHAPDTGPGRADPDNVVDPGAPDHNPSRHQDNGRAPGRAATLDRNTIVTRVRFGGVKIGSAFFGWLTATGMAVLLISLLTERRCRCGPYRVWWTGS